MRDLESKILLIGRSGCGKTFLGKKIQKDYPRKVVIDTKGHDYGPEDGKVVKTLDDFNRELRALYIQKAPRFTLIFKFSLGLSEEDREEQFEKVCELVLKFKNICFVVEELHRYCSAHKISKWFRDVLLMGRSFKVALIMTTPKPSLINNTITDMCTEIYIGTIRGVRDRQFCADFMGISFKEFEVKQPRVFYQVSDSQIKNIGPD